MGCLNIKNKEYWKYKIKINDNYPDKKNLSIRNT